MAAWRHIWIGIGFCLVLAVVVLSLVPHPPEAGFEQGDKLHHLLAYFVLMLWFAQLHEGRAGRGALAAGFVALGVMLEWLQGLSGYRDASVLDAIANAAGVVLGWVAAPPRLPNVLAWVERRGGGRWTGRRRSSS